MTTDLRLRESFSVDQECSRRSRGQDELVAVRWICGFLSEKVAELIGGIARCEPRLTDVRSELARGARWPCPVR